VLVADDSAVNREVACEALSRLGISASTAEDGRAACEAAIGGGYDLILMDGSMPEMDGFEATRVIRAHEEETGSRRTPIIALTAHVVGAGADEWRDAGMDGVLHKPFTIAKLAQCLSVWLAPGDHTEVQLASDIPASPAAEEELLDGESLAQLEAMASTSGRDFITRIIGLYFEHAPKAVDELRCAAAREEADAIARAAHSLKSMSVNVGATGLARLLSLIEGRARQDGHLPTKDEIGAVVAILAATMDALRRHFAYDPAPAEGPAVSDAGPAQDRLAG
jgi:two-component system sensor histidine kinase BarA